MQRLSVVSAAMMYIRKLTEYTLQEYFTATCSIYICQAPLLTWHQSSSLVISQRAAKMELLGKLDCARVYNEK